MAKKENEPSDKSINELIYEATLGTRSVADIAEEFNVDPEYVFEVQNRFNKEKVATDDK